MNENFNQWITLRDSQKTAKREKNYQTVIELSDKIISISKKSPDIGIMVAFFQRDIADAYMKLNDEKSAAKYCKLAIASFEKYRAKAKLSKPDDFLSDIATLQKKLDKLEHNK
jgi:hypothetical protein